MTALAMSGWRKNSCAAAAIRSTGMKEGAGLPHIELIAFSSFSPPAGNKPMMLTSSPGGNEIVGWNRFDDDGYHGHCDRHTMVMAF